MSRFSILAFAGALLLAPRASAAETTEGRFDGLVVNASDQSPIANALVSIAGYPGVARSDKSGRFSWAFTPAPPFQVIVVLASGEVMRPVVVEHVDAPVTISVNPLASESLTVIGAAPNVSTAPASGTTLLSGADVAERHPENLMQALETVPGVSAVSEGHAAAPALRGLARGRTLFLLDGGRVSAERRVGPSATFLDPSVVGSIDVSRGPASVAYGSDAFGGVISVKTRRAEPGSPLRGLVTGTLGAGIPEARGSVELSKGFARGGLLVQGHARKADDYDAPSGEVFNSGWKDSGFLAAFSHDLLGGALALTWQSDFGRDFERPRNNSRAVRFYYPYENSHRLSAQYDVSEVKGLEQVSFSAFLGTHDLRTDQDRFPTATAGRTIERADISARDFHVKASGERRFGSTKAEFGVDVNGRFGLRATDASLSFTPAGNPLASASTLSVDRARRADTGVFAQADVPMGAAVRFAAGLRLDRVTTRNAGGYFGDRSTGHTAVSGFASSTFGPFKGFSTTLQLARGFRDPVLSDRYFRGPSGRGFITGNPDLDPETSLQADVALRYTHARFQLALYGYQYRIEDLVERYETRTDFFFFRNRGRARLRGLEFESRADLGKGLSAAVFMQTARGLALDDGAFLDDAAPDTISLVVRKEFGEKAWTQARAARYADDDRPGPTEVATMGHTVVDLGGGFKFRRSFEARVLGRNLLDEEYAASPDPRHVPAPGRSISASLTARF